MRLASRVGRVVVEVLGVLLLALSLTALPYAVKAARGQGTHGTFTAERQECSRRACAHYGTWRADPPADRVVTDVLMDEWPADKPLGASVPALYLGETDPAVVYPAEESLAWLYILATAGLVLLFVRGAYAAIKELREDRRRARRMLGYEPRRVKHELDP